MTEIKPPYDELDTIINEYVDGYELTGDEGSYTPTLTEKLLIKDAIHGLLADTDWDNAWGRYIAALAKSQPVEQGSPVAWRGWNGDTWVFTLWRDEMPVQLDWEPLFIHPARQPMSDEKIDEILDAAYTNAIATGKTNGGMAGETWNLIAARAIEAHIKGATE